MVGNDQHRLLCCQLAASWKRRRWYATETCKAPVAWFGHQVPLIGGDGSREASEIDFMISIYQERGGIRDLEMMYCIKELQNPPK